MKIKKTLSVILSIIMLLMIVPSFSVYAEDDARLEVLQLDDDELHNIAEQSVNKLPNELLQKLSLKDSDVPESMKSTDVSKTNAVLRVKEQETDLSTIIYANNDGTYTEYLFSENVKYEKNGKVLDKSNELTPSLFNGGYINENNDINTVLPFVITENTGIKLNYNENKIEFIPANLNSFFTIGNKINEDTVLYKNAFCNGISLEYSAQFSGVKENIIISSDVGKYDFSFKVKTNGLFMKVLDDSVVLTEKTGETIADIGGIIVFDNKGKNGSGSFCVDEVIPGEEYLYNISISEDFFKSDISFPVTIDPTIIFHTSNLFYDSLLSYSAGDFSLDSTCTSVNLGYTGLSTFNRMLIKFPSLVTALKQISFNNITSIYLQLYRTSPYENKTVNCYRMTSNWSSTSGTTTSTVWNGYDSSSVATGYFYSSYNFGSINIKNICEKWIVDNYSNYGIMLKLTDESSNGLSVFTKENATGKPAVSITYNMPSDIEDIGLKEKCLYKLKNDFMSCYMGCNRSTNGTYTVTSYTSEPSAASTLENSVYFALYKDGNSGYFKLTPTNANFRGSKELWQTTEINYLYYDGSSVGVSSNYNNSNKSSWYVIKHNDGKYFILNRYYQNIALYVGSGTQSISTNEVLFSNLSHKWSFIYIGLDVPLIMQEQSTWCGAASLFQIIDFWGKKDYINGNDSSYQKRLFDIVKKGNAADIYKMRDEINQSKYHTPCDYEVYNKNRMQNKTKMSEYIVDSLQANQPVILLFDTQHLSYYNSKVQRHYACIIGYDNALNIFILRDCNNTYKLGNYAYFGEFTATADEIYTDQSYPYILCKDY